MSHGRDAALPRPERQQFGIYYTPQDLVRFVVDETLSGRAIRPPMAVLDPACGDGAFLADLARRIGPRRGNTVQLLRRSLFGIDRDVEAVAAARLNIAQQVLGPTAKAGPIQKLSDGLKGNIIVADALLDALPVDWPTAFDFIVGNPPYVNIRRLSQQDAGAVELYRERFRCARRGFDLYVLFIERALELLRSSGRCGLIVPNKLATLDYAAACRTMLVEKSRIHLVADVSDANHFQSASVYPHVLVFENSQPDVRHSLRIVDNGGDRKRLQSQLNVRGQFDLTGGFDVEFRVPTRPLGQVCRLHSGTTGFLAQQIAAELRELKDAPAAAFPFVTSGNIDRYQITPGNVRYMQRTFGDPVLPLDAGSLTAAKRCLFSEPKIVIAGMSRRLEAAWCDRPLALGVQVFAAAQICIDPFYLLAVLNSRLMSHLFRLRYSAKRLGGGYLSINKGQLAQLPIVAPSEMDRADDHPARRLSELARQASGGSIPLALEPELDALVYQLYRLTKAEIKSIDAEFEGLSLRAA